MNSRVACLLAFFALVFCLVPSRASAQAVAAPGATVSSPAPPVGSVPRLIKFSGVLDLLNPSATPAGTEKATAPVAVGVTFTLYELQEGGSPLWTESQEVQTDDQGRYSVLLGVTQPDGLPLDLFTSGKALWLGVQAQAPGAVEQPRVLLVAVPYALKASDSDTLGGKPASAYALTGPALSAANGSPTTIATVVASPSASDSSPAGQISPLTSICSSVTSNSGGTANTVAKFDSACDITNSLIQDNGTGVGIGTASPTSILTVSGDVTANGLLNVFQNVGGFNGIMGMDIGNTCSYFGCDRGWIGHGTTINATNYKVTANNESSMIYFGNADWIGFATIPLSNGTTYTENQLENTYTRLAVTDNGVGIGTTAPSAKLEVDSGNADTLRVDNTNGSGKDWVKFTTNNGTFTYADLLGSAWGLNLQLNSGWSGANFSITNGSVGIGTTTPAATLEVNGTAKFDQAVTFQQPVTFASGQTLTDNGNLFVGSGSPQGMPLEVQANGTDALTVTSGGKVTIGVGSSGLHVSTASPNTDFSGQISLSNQSSNFHSFSGSPAFTYPPVCVVTPTSNLGATTWYVTVTATTLTVSLSSGTATVTFNYFCVGNPN